ncbi:hypothetical protein BKA69DRAFT_1045832, partial [Paraphysoderma sedebokerense]
MLKSTLFLSLILLVCHTNALPQASLEVQCQGNVATAIGVNGRLFGFEKGKPCVISDPKNAVSQGLTFPSMLANPVRDISSFPACQGNTPTSVGSDGRAWGFENGRSCLIRGS